MADEPTGEQRARGRGGRASARGMIDRGRGGGRGRGRGIAEGSARGSDRGRASSRDRGSDRGRASSRGRGSDRGRGFSPSRGSSRGRSDGSRGTGTFTGRGRGTTTGRGRGGGESHSHSPRQTLRGGKQHAVPHHERHLSVEQEPKAQATASTSSSASASASPPPEPDVPIFERTSLTLASNPLPPLSTLSATLSKFTNLHKLDLSYMQPGEEDNTQGIESLRFLSDAHNMATKDRKRARKAKEKAVEGDEQRGVLGETLTLLNLSGNTSIGAAAGSSSSTSRTFQGLDVLKSLFVLNLASCALRVTPPKSTLLHLENLRALILSHNRLTTDSLKELPYLPNLNTIVLSHNQITALPRTFPANMPNLTKISISHNDLGGDVGGANDGDDSDSDSGSDDEDAEATTVLPNFTSNVHLREVRISHNKSLKSLPSHIATWGRGHGDAADGKGLFLLDAGHCDLSWDNVRDVLHSGKSSLRGLKNLTLAGNVRIEEAFNDGDDDESDAEESKGSTSTTTPYKQLVQDALPGLSVLDGSKLDKGPNEKSKKRKRGGDRRDDDDDDSRRLASRAGPAPDDDDDGQDAAAVVDSDDEGGEKRKKKKSKKATKDGPKPDFTPKQRVGGDDVDPSTPSKPRRAKRGQKKIDRLITGSMGHVEQDDEEDGGVESDAAEKSKVKPTSESKKEKKKKSRPSTAWDATPAPASAPSDVVVESAAAPAAPTGKAQTSIAGIIEVKKRKKELKGRMEEGDSSEKKSSLLGKRQYVGESIGDAASSAWGGGDELGGGSGSAWG